MAALASGLKVTRGPRRHHDSLPCQDFLGLTEKLPINISCSVHFDTYDLECLSSCSNIRCENTSFLTYFRSTVVLFTSFWSFCRFMIIYYASYSCPQLLSLSPSMWMASIGVGAQSPLGGQDIFARKNMYEKLTKCPNFA